MLCKTKIVVILMNSILSRKLFVNSVKIYDLAKFLNLDWKCSNYTLSDKCAWLKAISCSFNCDKLKCYLPLNNLVVNQSFISRVQNKENAKVWITSYLASELNQCISNSETVDILLNKLKCSLCDQSLNDCNCKEGDC